MKDTKFIELLNLYVDHQITPADAAWLENEIQQNPTRRHIYRQYCRMQKACVLLADNFRSAAPAAVAGGKVVEFEPHQRRLAPVFYAFGAVAAAACVAFVAIRRSDLTAIDPVAHAESVRPAAMVATTPATPATEVAAPARPALRPAFAGLERAAMNSDELATGGERANLEWMTRVQLERLPSTPLWFEAQPTLQAQELMFRSRPANQLQAENAAFRFQR